MPIRSLSQRSFYDPEIAQPYCLEEGTVPWVLARYRSLLFPAWLLSGWRGEGRRGRHAWPAVVLMTLLFLRWTEEGMSRLASTKRADTDIRWRAALGLHLQRPVPHEKTLREFEAFLLARHPLAGQPRYLLLHEHIVRLCLENGVVEQAPVWAIDSTPMWCYGAVQDTVNLLGNGTRTLVRRWAKVTGQKVEDVATQWKVPWVLAKSTKGHFGIDWHNPDQRAEVMEAVADGTLRTVGQVRHHLEQLPTNHHRRFLRRCRNLARVVEQNLETDEQGRLVVAKKVVADRIVSLTDPCARHGRKSKSRTFNGFKLHVLGDIVSGLITSLTVTQGNDHDGSVAHRLIGRAKALHQELDTVLGDTAYGGATLRHRTLATLDVRLVSPPALPPPNKRRPDALKRDDFTIDFQETTATCPQGIVADRHLKVWSKVHNCSTLVFVWNSKTCAACPVHERCRGTRKGGRRLQLHPHEQELRQARLEWQDAEIRALYRQRSQCERLVNQVVRHGGRRARSWGLGSANLQGHLIAMGCNLQLLARVLARKEVAHMAA